MKNPRPSAWALIGVLLATMTFAGGASSTLASTPNPAVCSPGQGPTQWTDEYHAPDQIRVLRSKGPDIGHVQTVNYWDYVATVVRAEYSTGADKPSLWMLIGALTVKQYAWYYTMHWRGGKVAITTTDPESQQTTTTVECYDVKDTTVDQIYKPQEVAPGGTVYQGNVPTPVIYQAMRETWHMSMRKWFSKKSKSGTKLFLSGYRSGKKHPCGTDATGFRIYQKSLRDCSAKGLTFGETLREYFEPNLRIVDTRANDALTGDGKFQGDLGVLAPGGGDQTQWRLYPGATGASDTFGVPTTGTFSVAFDSIIGYGAGNVDAADANGADDANLASDLLMLTNNKVFVAHSNGAGYDTPIATDLSAAADGLLVADFDGDMLADVGLLRQNGLDISLSVRLSDGAGGLAPEAPWWSGQLDLASSFVAAGDVNGDGKADLIMRSADGSFGTASSWPSCSNLSSMGTCPSDAIGTTGLGAAVAGFAVQPTWAASDVKNVVGDYDRDGRDDVISMVRDAGNGGIKVYGLRSIGDGTFADPDLLFSSSTIQFADSIPTALDVDPDGLADLALVQKDGSNTKVQWLRTIEKSSTKTTSTPAGMTPGAAYADSSLSWSPASLLPY